MPRGQPATKFEIEAGKAKIDFGVTPSGKYAEQHKDANGVIHHISWPEMISIPHQDAPPTLKTLAESIEVARVEGERHGSSRRCMA